MSFVDRTYPDIVRDVLTNLTQGITQEVHRVVYDPLQRPLVHCEPDDSMHRADASDQPRVILIHDLESPITAQLCRLALEFAVEQTPPYGLIHQSAVNEEIDLSRNRWTVRIGRSSRPVFRENRAAPVLDAASKRGPYPEPMLGEYCVDFSEQ